jgi:hypothetical protein
MTKRFIALCALAIATTLSAQPNEEYARYDAASNKWEFRMQPNSADGDTDWVTYYYVERNHINPKIQSKLHGSHDGFVYGYRISNDRIAKQTINYMVARAPFKPQLPEKTSPGAAELNSNPGAMRAWQQKLKTNREAKRKIQDSSMSKPAGWRRKMSFDEQMTGFGWFPEIEPYGPGVPPGRSTGGFELRRPELPGAVLAKMQGRVEEPALPDGYKLGGPVEQAINKILANDSVYAPILAPAINLPAPYNAAEHARRLKVHVQTWLGSAEVAPMVSQDMLDRINRHLDSLTQAAEYNNKSGVRSAFTALITDVFSHHRGMTHQNAEEDNEHDSDALPQHEGVANSRFSSEQGLHRVAARALTFNLMYLLTRVEMER